jgi:hypothetical protein
VTTEGEEMEIPCLLATNEPGGHDSGVYAETEWNDKKADEGSCYPTLANPTLAAKTKTRRGWGTHSFWLDVGLSSRCRVPQVPMF